MDNHEFVWMQKYRPTNIKDCILPEKTKKEIQSYIDKKDIPNLLLSGPPGVGKTTLAKVIANELNTELMFINASKDANIDVLRTKIQNYVSSVSFSESSTRKLLVLDEADNLSDQVQKALRSFTEDFSKSCSFIMTCNYMNKIISPLRSRFVEVNFVDKNKNDAVMSITKRMLTILKKENKLFDDKKVVTIVRNLVDKKYPDIRSVINSLQKYTSTSETIDVDILSNLNTSNIDSLISILKDQNFTNLRKWVAENSDIEFNHLCSELYLKLEDHVKKESLPSLILTINDFDRSASFVIQKEIHMTAFLLKLMMECDYV